MEYLRVQCTYVQHVCMEASDYHTNLSNTWNESDLPLVQSKYKDTVFRLLFREKMALLSLYNAVNGTNFDNAEDLEITTLENAVYLSMKNDVSFVFAFELNLYEHQSTINPNMPLRDLFYVARQLQKMIPEAKLYSSKAVKIPAPRFVVFYNGSAAMPERVEYRLSDLFEKNEKNPELELRVTAYNINPGMNEELLEGCRLLKEYMLFVEKIRQRYGFCDRKKSVNEVVDECIKEGILADFLRGQRAEVIAVSLYEFDQQEYEKMLREECREEGLKEGLEEGRKEGRIEALKMIYNNLISKGTSEAEALSILQISKEDIGD